MYPPGENRVRWAHVAGATHRVAGRDGDRRGLQNKNAPDLAQVEGTLVVVRSYGYSKMRVKTLR